MYQSAAAQPDNERQCGLVVIAAKSGSTLRNVNVYIPYYASQEAYGTGARELAMRVRDGLLLLEEKEQETPTTLIGELEPKAAVACGPSSNLDGVAQPDKHKLYIASGMRACCRLPACRSYRVPTARHVHWRAAEVPPIVVVSRRGNPPEPVAPAPEPTPEPTPVEANTRGAHTVMQSIVINETLSSDRAQHSGYHQKQAAKRASIYRLTLRRSGRRWTCRRLAIRRAGYGIYAAG